MARDRERLQEIRERLAAFEAAPTELVYRGHVASDLSCLLSRIETLERENEKLREDMRQIHVSYGGGVW